MTEERQIIVGLARSTIDAKWRHQGRDPKTGIDCAGVIIWVGWEAGYLPRDFDVRGYRRAPDGRTLAQALARHAQQKAWENWKPGDFVLLRDIVGNVPCHLGFLVPGREGQPNLVHSWVRRHKRCVEVSFEKHFQRQMVGVYSFKGVD